jgi:hypothetical protein
MKSMLKVTKKKVVIGVLSIGLVSGGLVGASNFGFIDQLGNILNRTTDAGARYAGDNVTSDGKNGRYEDLIVSDVNSAAKNVKEQLIPYGLDEISRGNTKVEEHYNLLKGEIYSTANTAIASGKTKITNAVDTKISTIKNLVEDAAVDAINLQLDSDSFFTGTDGVSK